MGADGCRSRASVASGSTNVFRDDAHRASEHARALTGLAAINVV
jgi:hypothetical protein